MLLHWVLLFLILVEECFCSVVLVLILYWTELKYNTSESLQVLRLLTVLLHHLLSADAAILISLAGFQSGLRRSCVSDRRVNQAVFNLVEKLPGTFLLS